MDIDKKRIGEVSFTSSNPEERFLVDMFSQIIGRLKQKYNYSDEELFKIWNNEEECLVPIAIFSGKLSPSEALAKFLKENYELNFSEISSIIGRDARGVWANYKRASKKMPWPFDIKEGSSVPATIFTPDKSILEALVSYLKDVRKLRNRKIAELLNKNPANIWTVYNRSIKKKNENK